MISFLRNYPGLLKRIVAVGLAALIFCLAPLSLAPLGASLATVPVAYAQNTASTAGGTTATSQTPTVSVDCSISFSPTTWGAFFSPTCWGRTIATVIGTTLIWIGSYVLYWSGLLFDWVMTETVLQFGTLINSGVISAINTAWTAFRDISNIVIIGMFTFIAIATILGNTEYGYKKMLSRVLIVAVLINFSLLFTKVIIDASNFTAVQFLNAASASQASSCPQCSQLDNTQFNGTATNASTGIPTGIAGAFLEYAGAQSWGNSFAELNAISQDPQNGGWYALLYGFVVSILEIAAALVLLYGTFLLVARALLMVFLMFTSSIAFATYLVPSEWTGGYGWSIWWKTLLKNAVFAPLLAILLWVTLTVAQAFHTAINPNGQVMSLGSLIPSQGNQQPASIGIEALFGYVLVIGLLFITFKLSSSFASGVTGLNWGNLAWGKAVSGVADAGGFLRQTAVGRWAYGRQNENEAQAKEDRLNAARARRSVKIHENAGNPALAAFARSEAERLEKRAASKTKNAERYGSFASGYKKRVQDSSKKVTESVNRSQPSKEALAADRAEREKTIREERQRQFEQTQKTSELAKENAEKLRKTLAENTAQKNSADADVKQNAKVLTDEIQKELKSNPALEGDQRYKDAQNEFEEKKNNAEKKMADAEKTHMEHVKAINEQIGRGGINDDRKQQLQSELLRSEESRKSEMRHESDNIEKARQQMLIKTAELAPETSKALKAAAEALRAAQGSFEKADSQSRDIQQRLTDTQKVIDNAPKKSGFDKETNEQIQRMRNLTNEAQHETTNNMVNSVAASQVGILGRTFGTNNDVAKAARSKLKTAEENHTVQKMINEHIEAQKNNEGGGGH